jgi:hypothetical protein
MPAKKGVKKIATKTAVEGETHSDIARNVRHSGEIILQYNDAYLLLYSDL